MLPTLSTNARGEVRHHKEPFAFGGTDAPISVGDDGDLSRMYGPDPRSTPATASMPALWLWESNDARRARLERTLHLQRGLPSGATDAEQVRRVTGLCENGTTFGRPNAGQSCTMVSKRAPGSWACKWDSRLHTELNRTQAYCIRSQTPWLAPREANVTLLDFTPNYMCDAEAMRRIAVSAPDRDALRFLVLLRDPIMRAYSEFAMFAYGYWWERCAALSLPSHTRDRHVV